MLLAGAGAGNVWNACEGRQAGRQNEDQDSGRNRTPEAGGHGSGDPGTASHPLGLFSARLKRLRTESGIKQADFLSAAVLKRTQVSAILNGKIQRPPDWAVTVAIVRACLKHAKGAGRLALVFHEA